MLNRQRTVLHLLELAGGTAGKIQVVKWCFLMAEEGSATDGSFYQFVPYQYGPYSFSLAWEIEALARDGYVKETDKSWGLTERGQKAASQLPPELQRDATLVIRRYGEQALDQLIETVYSRFPWYTMNSRFEERRAVERPVGHPAVYTCGYERLQIDAFLDRLLRAGIKRLADVRANPVSRRYGFHKSSLSRLCGHVGITYEHIPDLGVPTELRADLNSLADYERLFGTYEQQTLPAKEAFVLKLAQQIVGEPTVIVCQEADPKFCHRSRLATRLAELTKLNIVHLGWPR